MSDSKVVMRVGCGYDVHAFAPARALVLGGVRVPHERGLAGHSDGDVLTHAVVDALLGAAGLGDIGDWFPPGDVRYRDGDSLVFLDRVARALGERGWRVVNLDATVVAQAPGLGELRAEMGERLAERLGIERGRVSVKATTPDHLGSVGRGEGIAAQAVVLVEAVEGVADR